MTKNEYDMLNSLNVIEFDDTTIPLDSIREQMTDGWTGVCWVGQCTVCVLGLTFLTLCRMAIYMVVLLFLKIMRRR